MANKTFSWNEVKRRLHGSSAEKLLEVIPEGYIAFVEELPGVNTQGATLEEARSNLQEAVEMVLDANRTLAEKRSMGANLFVNPLSPFLREASRRHSALGTERVRVSQY